MIQNDQAPTAMAREIQDIPPATERLLAQREAVIAVARRIRSANPSVVVISAAEVPGTPGFFSGTCSKLGLVCWYRWLLLPF